MNLSVSAPGKLMLLGEHAVVYGRKCIVTAVDAQVIVSVRPNAEFHLDAPDVGFSGKFDINEKDFPKSASFAITAVQNFYEKHGIKQPVSISTKSLVTSEKKVGLGSSASVTVAAIKALSSHFGIGMDERQIFDMAYKTVLDVQGVGSGFDVAAAAFGGTLMYKIGRPEPIKCEALNMVIGYTGISASTLEIVRKVGDAVREQPDYYDNLFDEIEKLVVRAKASIEENDLEQLGALMNQNQNLLREMKVPSEELGVSSEVLERLISAALDAGAYGAKLSGAGVGDCMISVVPEERRKDVELAIADSGGTVINAKPNVAGARILGD